MLKNAGIILSVMKGAFRVGAAAVDYFSQKPGLFKKKKSFVESVLDDKNSAGYLLGETAKDFFKK